MAAVTFDQALDFTRGSEGTYIGPDGRLKAAAIDGPRFTYDPATGEPLGLLVEEQRTNLLLWSEDFSQAVWSKSVLSASYNSEVAPDGTTTAGVFESDTTGIFQDFSVTEGNSYSAGYFVKLLSPGENKGGIYDVTNASWIINANNKVTTTNAGSWERVSFENIIAPVGCTTMRLYVLRGNTIDSQTPQAVWGAQLEQASTPSSYIPTGASQVTRLADSVSRTLGQEYNPNEGTYFIEFEETTGNSRGVLGFKNAGQQTLIYSNTGSGYRAYDGTNILSIRAPTAELDGVAKIALTYKAGLWTACMNGAIGDVDVAMNFTGSELALGYRLGAVSNPPKGVRNLRYIPNALPEQELIDLTTL